MINLYFLLPLFVFAAIICLVSLTLCKKLNDIKKTSSHRINSNIRRQINNDDCPYIIPIPSNDRTIQSSVSSVSAATVTTTTTTPSPSPPPMTMISYSSVDQLFINALSLSPTSSTSLPTLSQLNQNSSDIYKFHEDIPPPKYDDLPPPCYEEAIATIKNKKF